MGKKENVSNILKWCRVDRMDGSGIKWKTASKVCCCEDVMVVGCETMACAPSLYKHRISSRVEDIYLQVGSQSYL